MLYTLGKNDYFINLLEKLYGNNILINNLNEIKKRMRLVHNYTIPQFDDIEAEIVCLILMFLNPKNIYEFSPCGGWSTLYMLNTLDVINNKKCNVHSFDIIDKCTSNINKFDNLVNQWNFHLGNVEDMSYMFRSAISFNQPTNFNTVNVKNMDYMFFDAQKFNQDISFNYSNTNILMKKSIIYL